MPLDEPSWWYPATPRRSARLLPHLLQPVAGIYGAIARARLRRAPAARASMPVICVGNFTAGGTGKTPIAIAIAQLLRHLGRTPVFLSRGYGGIRRGPHTVDANIDHAGTVGDEPLLLAASAPTVVARDRAAGAGYIRDHRLGDVIVMDDGLQNRSLAKTLTLAVVDSRRGLGNGRVLPAGPLRAPVDAQLAVTDAIVVTGRAAAAPDTPAELPAPLRHFDGPCLTAHVVPAADVDWLKQAPILAFAGIANPDRFFDLLTALGGDLRQRRTFRDHHMFATEELEQLIADADDAGLQLVTTDKDYVRLGPASVAARRVRQLAKVLPIEPAFAPADLQRLKDMLAAAVA